jgi:hypothetical protein
VTNGKNQRTNGISFLALFVLGVAAWNGVRLVQGIFLWTTLRQYGVYPGPAYISIGGGIWLLAGLITAWGLWRIKPWAWYAGTFSPLLYAIWYWFDRLIEQQPHANWPFTLSATLVILMVFTTIMFWPKTRNAFLKDNYERIPKVQRS